MDYFRKNFNRVKNSVFLSRFRTTLFLLIVILFFFNFNYDSFLVRGDFQVYGEGTVGYLARWLTGMLSYVQVTGEGYGHYIPKWTVSLPTASVSLTLPTIFTGESTTLTWSSTNATSCTGTNFSTGGATSGSITVSPNNTTVYSVTCSGSSAANSTLTVKKKPKFIEK